LACSIEILKDRKIKVRWPLLIYTDDGPIEGETRTLTGAGIFVRCEERLRKNKIYRMIIKHPKMAIEVEGQLTWLNLDGGGHESIFPAMNFSFLRISDADPQSLKTIEDDRRVV
jgi:hypothetical protein